MDQHNNSVAVCYLARDPEKKGFLSNFLKSYVAFKPNLKHELILLIKGSNLSELIGADAALLRRIPHKVLDVPDTGFDIGSYVYAAQQLDHTYICFLNSYSQILASNWLQFLVLPLASGEAGLTGCTGSWSSIRTSARYLVPNTSFHNLFSKFKFFFQHPEFPNPHIRSNAFAIRRTVFLSLSIPNLKDKHKAWTVESGRKSITRQVQRFGYHTKIVNSAGKSFLPREWHLAETFWMNNQALLLIGDNQTEEYRKGNQTTRSFYAAFAWLHPVFHFRLTLSLNKLHLIFPFFKRTAYLPTWPLPKLARYTGSTAGLNLNFGGAWWMPSKNDSFFLLGRSEDFTVWWKVTFLLIPLKKELPMPEIIIGDAPGTPAVRRSGSFEYSCFIRLTTLGQKIFLFPGTGSSPFYLARLRVTELSYRHFVFAAFQREPGMIFLAPFKGVLSYFKGTRKFKSVLHSVKAEMDAELLPMLNTETGSESERLMEFNNLHSGLYR
jgi:hypothetical protein